MFFATLRSYGFPSGMACQVVGLIWAAFAASLSPVKGQESVNHPALKDRPIAEIPAPSLLVGNVFKGRANLLYQHGVLATPNSPLPPMDSLIPGDLVQTRMSPAVAPAPMGRVSMKAAIVEQDQDSTESPKITFGTAVWTFGKDSNAPVRVSADFPNLGLRAMLTFQSRTVADTAPLSMRIYATTTDLKTFQSPLIRELPRTRRFGSSDGDNLGIVLQSGGPNEWVVPLLRANGNLDLSLALLFERPWIDVPLASRQGKKVVLTVEKGALVNTALRTLLANAENQERPIQ